jgi:hypothetical protein
MDRLALWKLLDAFHSSARAIVRHVAARHDHAAWTAS